MWMNDESEVISEKNKEEEKFENKERNWKEISSPPLEEWKSAKNK